MAKLKSALYLAPTASAPINIGISEKDRAAIAKGLSHLLADTYTLYLTTHNFHWNVTGPMFNTLHQMFMVQYTELWTAVDPIAERIRSLGHPAPQPARSGSTRRTGDANATIHPTEPANVPSSSMLRATPLSPPGFCPKAVRGDSPRSCSVR